MNIPLSWLKDYVDVDISLLDLARLLTGIGLEVDAIRLVGLVDAGLESENTRIEFKTYGLGWDREKIVVAQIDEVMPHPNADRLVLCNLQDGRNDYTVLTGAPNLFEYKGKGPLAKPLKVAYAKEGAQIYDGHQPGQVLTTLKRAKIRGVDSFSMVCSEKELGISDEHEGVIILDEDAPTGKPLVDYMGDAVFEISILPNMIRNACVLGVAREVAARLGKPLRKPVRSISASGASIKGQAGIIISDPTLNPRFTLGLVRGVQARPSPYWVQRRLRLAGMRPINSIVDATNYVMLELGEPLHAFDYDVLVQRAGGKPPTIITRPAKNGERLTTLDGTEHTLQDFTILVTDSAGPLSLAGVMGGAESEVTDATRNVLLEGASWNFVNVRRTTAALKITSEAGYRFARGIHPALAPQAVELGLDRMAAWSGGQVAPGLIDSYPAPAHDPELELSEADVRRCLGVDIPVTQIASILGGLEFRCRIKGRSVHVVVPPHRLDVGTGLEGRADLIEEVARHYGYDRIPATRLATALPEYKHNHELDLEEKARDILTSLGLQEVITYRLTSPEREERLLPPGSAAPNLPYVRLQNPLAPERCAMRRSLLAAVLEVVERNIRLSPRLALYEVGPVFQPLEGQLLPAEPRRLAIVLTGQRHPDSFDCHENAPMDFYDLKGIIEAMLDLFHIFGASFEPAAQNGIFHPGKCADLLLGEAVIGSLGELHPLVKARYDLGDTPILAAEFDVDGLLAAVPVRHLIESVPAHPPMLEDLAVIVDDAVPAERVAAVIRQGGGKLVTSVRLFDIYRGTQIGEGKKSLAFSLTYQSPDRTLTSEESAQVRKRIIRRLEQDLGAKLRG